MTTVLAMAWGIAIGGALGAWLMFLSSERAIQPARDAVTLRVLQTILNQIGVIMASEKEQVAQLNEALDILRKTAVEIEGLKTESAALVVKVAELEALIQSGDDASQELVDAVAAIKAQAQALDEAIPDAPVIPPVEPPVVDSGTGTGNPA